VLAAAGWASHAMSPAGGIGGSGLSRRAHEVQFGRRQRIAALVAGLAAIAFTALYLISDR
jgi:hypothetical protein